MRISTSHNSLTKIPAVSNPIIAPAGSANADTTASFIKNFIFLPYSKHRCQIKNRREEPSNFYPTLVGVNRAFPPPYFYIIDEGGIRRMAG